MREHDQDKITGDDIEAALSALTPVAAAVDRDTLMYQAGYEAALSTVANPERSRSRQTLVRKSTAEVTDAAPSKGSSSRSKRSLSRFPKLWRVRRRQDATSTTRSLQHPIRRKIRFWQATTGLMTAASVALATMLTAPSQTGRPATLASHEPDTTHDAQAPVAEKRDATPPATPPKPQPPKPATSEAEFAARPTGRLFDGDPATNYLALRAAVLQRGVDRWPGEDRTPVHDASFEPPRRASTVHSLLQELLPPTPNPDASSEESPSDASVKDRESIA